MGNIVLLEKSLVSIHGACTDGRCCFSRSVRRLGRKNQVEGEPAGAAQDGVLRSANADLGGQGMRAGAGDDDAGGEDVSVRPVPVLRRNISIA